MNTILLSFVKNAILGIVAYLIIVIPREYLRIFLYKLNLSIFFSERIEKEESIYLRKPHFYSYIDPLGLITFLFLDFGWSHTPGIDYRKVKGKRLFIFSSLGIISNILLFLIYGTISRLTNSNYAFQLFYVGAKWSLTMAIISLFPFPPLDGSKLILSFLPSKYYEWYLKFSFYGILFMIGLIVLWIFPMIMQPLIIFISNVTNFLIF
ncbi:MAG: site-2 protease family protein [Fervidobacterium sp.]